MSGIYTITVEREFAAAHVIHGYNGPCSRLHGHNWVIECSVKSSKLDNIGIAFDFKDLKKVMDSVLDRLDHQNLNEIEPFTTINPTAENLACWMYQEFKKQLESHENVWLDMVAIWENARSCVRYQEA